ncbi:MAG: 50S ribosomal protein L23 [Candidatus Yanofskybacteria bacterium RIFCSPHIGHO2_01_FULL_39_8b]|uniref:Large ribosomal subunit protein uL23 n=1 Tax=Candidatus Yanofskybacteria bacterium RIFCSPHIGHO2_01_FULL_39_8b TaxID=1802659 RepID=A0A1F8E935_9BACT|nr:MAG: 50S ribosomal protein L23 [Candidatus Yanofskybacteria bacterium RIFCSPHIGHO2_01_FULL_39_8b]
MTGQGSVSFSGTGSSGVHKVLKGFYVSEKASMGNGTGQYMFKVFQNANKSEVKKEVSKLFNVQVKKVKILNMPEKRRDFGKHPGAKPGFKKAIVVLKEGFTIGQAKP